ncbi:hypothetical protein [Amycolatopsis albispora]|uniref:hypothetical protein n=1 Tax=Amycolatopsis albispora TaxID=1804986 RepID=UPI000DE512C3|nr:hypothetical protein [Amycolatopsis albispora]
MTEPRVLLDEPGAGGAPLLWGPGFALAGFLLELLAGGPVHGIEWVLVGLVLLGVTMLWVYARRRFLSVKVTTEALWQGRESLPVERIKELDDVGAPVGAKVLGGGPAVPRKFDGVPLRLDDGSVVLAWARDAEKLRAALRRVTGIVRESDGE